MSLDSNRRSRAKRRRDAIIALGGACARCGESDPVVLEIDHILQRDKDSEVKKNGQHNFNEVNRMVKSNRDPCSKFQALCANCHKRKTKENEDWKRHG